MDRRYIKQIDNIIEYPRKDYSPDQPEYESDVYNIPKAIAQNKKHMGLNGRPNKIEVVNINFAARKNNRKE